MIRSPQPPRRLHPARIAVASALCASAAYAQQAPADDDATDATLPPVVVTGEKTTRPIEQTSPSVKVFGARDLDANPGLATARNLLENTVNVTSSGTQNFAPAVRGIDGTGPSQGADAYYAGTRSRLNVQVDGRAASFNEIVFGDLGLWDVQQVEIFRGAQSTLQGRNAIAGTVIYKTNDPGFEPEYGARLLTGNHRQRQAAAVLSGPILEDEIAYRIAVDRQTSETFVKGFAGYPGVADPGEYEASNMRGKLLFKPKSLPGFSTLLTLARTDSRMPQTEAVARPFGDLTVPASRSYRQMPVFAPKVTSGIVDTTWHLSDAWTLENRLVAGDFRIRRHAAPGDGSSLVDGNDYTLEPRLRYAAPDKRLSGLVGLYGFRADQRDTMNLLGGGAWKDRTRTTAIYGEITSALGAVYELTLGGRYEREHRLRQGSLAFFKTDFDETYTPFLPKLSLAWKANADHTFGAAVARGYNGGNAGFTYQRPYTNYTYDPEYVWNYEAFARSRLLDGRLRLNGNLFLSRYKDMQLPFDQNPDPTVWSYVVRNAPRAETYGAEFGAAWLPLRDLELSADVGLLRTRVTRYPNSGVQGHELPRAPRFTTVLGADWRAPHGWTLGASARYSSAYYSDITNLPRAKVEPGWLFNARASRLIGKARLFAYVNNLFDSQRPLLISTDPGAVSDAKDLANLPRPRTVGLGVEFWL
jgi:outer membrane receptor protein involved in Fe transport